MEIYSIDENGYITEKKSVGNKYVLGENDKMKSISHKVGCHHITGNTKPKSDEEINKAKTIELRQLITDKKLLDEPCTAEQAELKQLLGL